MNDRKHASNDGGDNCHLQIDCTTCLEDLVNRYNSQFRHPLWIILIKNFYSVTELHTISKATTSFVSNIIFTIKPLFQTANEDFIQIGTLLSFLGNFLRECSML